VVFPSDLPKGPNFSSFGTQGRCEAPTVFLLRSMCVRVARQRKRRFIVGSIWHSKGRYEAPKVQKSLRASSVCCHFSSLPSVISKLCLYCFGQCAYALLASASEGLLLAPFGTQKDDVRHRKSKNRCTIRASSVTSRRLRPCDVICYFDFCNTV
jgi:hypothetical protein